MKRITPFTFHRTFGDQPMQRDFTAKIPDPDAKEEEEAPKKATRKKPAKP